MTFLSALGRAHADAGGKGLYLLDLEMLGNFLLRRMTFCIVS